MKKKIIIKKKDEKRIIKKIIMSMATDHQEAGVVLVAPTKGRNSPLGDGLCGRGLLIRVIIDFGFYRVIGHAEVVGVA